MKSAKNHLHVLLTVLLVCSSMLLSSCGGSSFLSVFKQDEQPPQNDQTDNAGNTTDTTSPQDPPKVEQEPPKPIFYNRYTGLACDEAISSCRPISVCIGNFDNSAQYGLSFADICIEAPIESGATRCWALSTAYETEWNKISSVSSVREYMMPILSSFDAIAAYAGTTDTPGVATSPYAGNSLDYIYHNLTSTFKKESNGSITTTGTLLTAAAQQSGFSLNDSMRTLPYQICAPDKKITPSGNRINSIHFAFSSSAKVGFTYSTDQGLYYRSQNGQAHIDAANGEQLAYSNILLLLHNVNYYYTPDNTTFDLDTEAGGSGFCYTGGGVISIRWVQDSKGNLTFYDEDDNVLTLNCGKTYIGMMKITDSTSIIAK